MVSVQIDAVRLSFMGKDIIETSLTIRALDAKGLRRQWECMHTWPSSENFIVPESAIRAVEGTG